MNIRDLTYLIAIADHRHFGKAADACFVSQPALSMQIKKLEEMLGVQLIERNTKSIMLTDIGERIVKQARDILTKVDTLKETAKSARDPLSGDLRLGLIPTLAPYLLPHIMPTLSKQFPNLHFYLIEEQTHILLKQLQEGKIDAAILALPLEEEEFTAIPLFEEPFLLATPKHHPLTKRKTVKITDLQNISLLLLTEGHCLRDQALSFCHSIHTNEVKTFRATSLETLRYMIANNAGITLMPELACRPTEGICYLPFPKPAPTRTIGLVLRSSAPKLTALQKIAENIKKSLGKYCKGVKVS